MKKTGLFVGSITLLTVIVAMALNLAGCGGSSGLNAGSGNNNNSTGNYTLSGRVGTVVGVSGLRALSTSTEVTNIVAIGGDNSKTSATLTDGIFSLSINSGQPYVLGFYNKTGTTITLLGYLKNSDYDWDSLPIFSPADTATDLGTIEINVASVEATPSIDITSLIGEMDLETSEATLYGAIDDSLAVLTNLDIDQNGTFDFDEDKNYLLQTYIGMATSNSGEIDAMLVDYNSTYIPRPSFYNFFFSALGDRITSSAVGTSGTTHAPAAIGGSTTDTSTVTVLGSGWSLGAFSSTTTPTVAPSGTYTMEVNSITYVVKHFRSSDNIAIGSNNNIVYPVFHLVTDEAGKIITAQYKWKKLVNGTIVPATTTEVATSINYSSADNYTHCPFISFWTSGVNMVRFSASNGIIFMPLTTTEVDVSGLNKTRAELDHIQAGYELTSKVICKFELY